MVPNKSLDKFELIATLLFSAHKRYGAVFNTKQLRLTTQVVRRRCLTEGDGFLTKTLPRLCKHLDQALTGTIKLNPTSCGFTTIRGSELPRFLGELFSLIFQKDGLLLPDPDANCVRVIRGILLCFYKYELPYTDIQEQTVIKAFKQAEIDLLQLDTLFAELQDRYPIYCYDTVVKRKPYGLNDHPPSLETMMLKTVRGARRALNELFMHFDPSDIRPRHGPGAVATKQRLWDKFLWTNVSKSITDVYPFDEYFCSSLGHVCDSYSGFSAITDQSLPARVLLVPKDSRGPRLISCEPVDYQWVQQGLGRAIVEHVEKHWISRFNVFFTNQEPNRFGALLGSKTGGYATLDLKEASDRVHLELVRLIFPGRIFPYLEACRSMSTVLPNGEELKLRKFAPMGSALCFPIMALTIWSLLTASAPDADTREGILVYGDDVIVPTAYAESAMAILELFGLKINRSKSCTRGFFKESCGVDAFKGYDVTPVRLRTVWDESSRPDVYTSWISYANSYYDRQEFATYDYIVGRILSVYGKVPDDSMGLSYDKDSQPVPCLREVPAEYRPLRRRWNKHLQKMQYYVRAVKSPSISYDITGWSMLLRFFSEGAKTALGVGNWYSDDPALYEVSVPFTVNQYTKRGTSMLVHRWR